MSSVGEMTERHGKRMAIIHGLMPGTEYCFIVCAATALGVGAWSKPSVGIQTLSTAPMPPTTVDARVIRAPDVTQVRLIALLLDNNIRLLKMQLGCLIHRLRALGLASFIDLGHNHRPRPHGYATRCLTAG